jgi:internalin A
LSASSRHFSSEILAFIYEHANVPRVFAPIGDEQVVFLKGLRDLQQLHLGNTKISNRGLQQVADIAGLEHLYLTNTSITDEGLQTLVQLPRLKQLVLLSCSGIGEAGLIHLQSSVPVIAASFPKLKHLSLVGIAELDDEHIMPLVALAQLEELQVAETSVTQRGAERIQKAMPNCKVLLVIQ